MLLLDAILGAMLSSTWHQLGAILRAKSAPSWLQVAQKTDPTTNQKNDFEWVPDRFLVDFGSNLGGPGGVLERTFGGPFGLLGPR